MFKTSKDMSTIIKVNPQPTKSPQSLSYLSGKNVFKVGERYFLIAQCDYGQMVIFDLKDDMEWNREFSPVMVTWHELNTETIKEYFPSWKDEEIVRVNAKITIEIF